MEAGMMSVPSGPATEKTHGPGIGTIGIAADGATYARESLVKQVESAKARISELDETIAHTEDQLTTMKRERGAHCSFIETIEGSEPKVVGG